VVMLAPRRRARNAEGRMPLGDHLRELRHRVIVAAFAVVAGTIAGWFLARPTMMHFIINPLAADSAKGHQVTLIYTTVASAFNIQVKVAVYIGVVLASPVWIYQLWAFITPGLTRKERRYSLVFMGFAVPLFLSGVTVAVLVFPKVVSFGAAFALNGTRNYPDFETVITLAFRLVVALGTAFLLPLFLVGLNLVGFLPGRTLGKHWRIAVFIAFLFAAVVSPSPEASQMIILALPLVGLYVISVAISLFNDRRKARRLAAADPFADGEYRATPLDDLDPALVEPGTPGYGTEPGYRPEPVERLGGLDDIT
jgi:sec-independent protein translocase protein TatC